MTTSHKTSEDLLLRYAAGRLRPAPALVVASHLAMSKSSRPFPSPTDPPVTGKGSTTDRRCSAVWQRISA